MTIPPKKPKIFIGSSREAIKYGQAIHANLSRTAQVLPWYDGTFVANEYTMDALKRRLEECDYGVFVFSPDDVAKIRGKYVFITRDNTIFEAGLFIGRLGLKRVFCIIPQEVETSEGDQIQGVSITNYHLLSDLSGISLLQYEFGHDGEYQAAVSVAAARISDEINENQFFIDPNDRAKRNGSIAKLLWEYFRISPLLTETTLDRRFHALSEAVRLSFIAPPIGECRVTHVALYAKQGTDGMAYVAGNIDEGAFHPFQTPSGEEAHIVIQVQRSGKWSFTHGQQVEKLNVLCYPLGESHVISITISGEITLKKALLDSVVDQNIELLTTIKHIVGGDA